MKYFKKINFIKQIYAFNVTYRDLWIKEQAYKISNGSKVLDVGAGSCPYRELFTHCEYYTQDVAQLQPEQIRFGGYGQIDFVGDASSISVENGFFDAVICTEMLEHHPEPIKVVKELARILRPGGLLLLTAPLGSGIHQEPYHYYGGYTPYWFRRFLPESGFEKVVVEPNAGFFRHYGQESIRFLQLSNPAKLKTHKLLVLSWVPLWALLFPFLGILMPLLCAVIDPVDKEKRFTVGYHVKAVRSQK